MFFILRDGVRTEEGQREGDIGSEVGLVLMAESLMQGSISKTVWDHDLSQSWMLSQPSHPGAVMSLLLNNSITLTTK